MDSNEIYPTNFSVCTCSKQVTETQDPEWYTIKSSIVCNLPKSAIVTKR
jgi:hypothetical protein